LEKGSGVFGEQAGSYFYLVVQFGRTEQLEAGAEGPALEIVRCVDETRNASLDNRASTHGTGLKSDKESCARKAVVAEDTGTFPDYDDFGMSGGIVVANGAVAGARENLTAVNEYGPDGDFASVSRRACLGKSELHELQIVRHEQDENITTEEK
jgi:hypothetical protein